MPLLNQHEWVQFHIFTVGYSDIKTVCVKKKGIVTPFPHFKTSPNSLPPLFSSALAYLLFFISLRSHLFSPFFARSLVIILLLFIAYSLNHRSLMSFSLTFFIRQ